MPSRIRKPKEKETRVFSMFATERMEDYAALSIALLILIIVLIIHQ